MGALTQDRRKKKILCYAAFSFLYTSAMGLFIVLPFSAFTQKKKKKTFGGGMNGPLFFFFHVFFFVILSGG